MPDAEYTPHHLSKLLQGTYVQTIIHKRKDYEKKTITNVNREIPRVNGLAQQLLGFVGKEWCGVFKSQVYISLVSLNEGVKQPKKEEASIINYKIQYTRVAVVALHTI